MKKQKMKWIKEYGWVLPVLLLVFSLAVAGSFAAYVNKMLQVGVWIEI